METLQRLRMSWGECLALPEKPRAGWVDGEVVVSPPVGPERGSAVIELAITRRRALPQPRAMTDVGLRLPADRWRTPQAAVGLRTIPG